MKWHKLEFQLIAELMRNSKQSDREIAKKLRVSQPTVTRLRTRLEKEGYIKEYTMIPDFAKLGYELIALTFLRYEAITPEELEKAKKIAKKLLEETYDECILIETGNGFGYQAAIISFHEDYSSYSGFMNRIKEGAHERYPFMDTSSYQSFLISLKAEQHFRPLTLSTLANNLLTIKEKKD